MSSSRGLHCSSSERELDGVEVYDGWLENSGAFRRGDDGADDGRDVGSLEVSYPTAAYLDLRFEEDREYDDGVWIERYEVEDELRRKGAPKCALPSP